MITQSRTSEAEFSTTTGRESASSGNRSSYKTAAFRSSKRELVVENKIDDDNNNDDDDSAMNMDYLMAQTNNDYVSFRESHADRRTVKKVSIDTK